jgi:thioredoxin-like negative regulator of GroEL
MKEFFVAFIVALAAGSIYNQMSGIDPGFQGGPSSGGSEIGNSLTGGAGGDNLSISPQAQAGQSLVADVDEGSFQGMVLDSREPVLVEFYTDNCPHCKTMGPVLGQLAYNGQGIVTVCKINASKSASIAERYEISGVPAFVLFNEGHMLDTTAGARSVEDLRAWLAQNNVSVPAKVGNNGVQM